MANRDDQPFRGLVPDHHGRSVLKDAVSHYLSPPNPLTSTAPQAFPNNLTMPLRRPPDRIQAWSTCSAPCAPSGQVGDRALPGQDSEQHVCRVDLVFDGG